MKGVGAMGGLSELEKKEDAGEEGIMTLTLNSFGQKTQHLSSDCLPEITYRQDNGKKNIERRKVNFFYLFIYLFICIRWFHRGIIQRLKKSDG